MGLIGNIAYHRVCTLLPQDCVNDYLPGAYPGSDKSACQLRDLTPIESNV